MSPAVQLRNPEALLCLLPAVQLLYLITMADGEFDLDAMLDSALDEEFDAPATAPKAGGESDGELDLDAMLDEALDGKAAAAPEQKQSVVASEKTSGAGRQVLGACSLDYAVT